MARTPSKEAHEKVLRAAVDLIAERGVEGASMDAIAAASGVSKATIYKHWSGKEDLVLDLFRRQIGSLPTVTTGDCRVDLTGFLRFLMQAQRSRDMNRIWARLMAHAMSNPEFGRALQEYAFAPRLAHVARLIREGQSQGTLRRGIDVKFAADMLMGPVMHRRFVSDGKLPADLPDRIVEVFFTVWGATSTRLTPNSP